MYETIRGCQADSSSTMTMRLYTWLQHGAAVVDEKELTPTQFSLFAGSLKFDFLFPNESGDRKEKRFVAINMALNRKDAVRAKDDSFVRLSLYPTQVGSATCNFPFLLLPSSYASVYFSLAHCPWSPNFSLLSFHQFSRLPRHYSFALHVQTVSMCSH